MAADAFQQKTVKGSSPIVHGFGLADVDSEFVTQASRRNMVMGGGVDVGIHPQRHASLDTAAVGQRVDQRQFGFGFAVEGEDSGFEGRVDFRGCFPYTGEHDVTGIAAGLEHAVQLAAADDVESRSGRRQ